MSEFDKVINITKRSGTAANDSAKRSGVDKVLMSGESEIHRNGRRKKVMRSTQEKTDLTKLQEVHGIFRTD